MTTESAGTALPPSRQPWEHVTPEQTGEILRGLEVPWYIAGGWAIDLFLGRQTRSHDDLDLVVLRGDEDALRRHLRDWELHLVAEHDVLVPLREGDPLPADTWGIWARRRGQTLWQLEILVERREGDRWSYRRDPAIGLHARDIGRKTEQGIPYLRPEIPLLYKSKSTRPNDETDFLTVLPRLDPAQRAFLAAALWTTAPGHRWLERLK